MEITIRHTPECQSVGPVLDRLSRALREAGVNGATTRLEVIGDVDAAERTGFGGSPTILIDGEDPFALEGAVPAFACRIYVTSEGRDVAPSVAQLRDALERRRR